MGKPMLIEYSLIVYCYLDYVCLRICLISSDDLCRVCVAIYCTFSPTTFDALINLANIYFLNKLFTTKTNNCKISKNDRNLTCKKNKLTIFYLPDSMKLFSFLYL